MEEAEHVERAVVVAIGARGDLRRPELVHEGLAGRIRGAPPVDSLLPPVEQCQAISQEQPRNSGNRMYPSEIRT